MNTVLDRVDSHQEWNSLATALERSLHRLRLLVGDTERCLSDLHRDYECLAVAARGFERPAGESLTHQERRVAMLVMAGRTDAETAAMLQLSVHTVKSHVKNILRKLGLRSRWQLPDVLISSAPGLEGRR